MTEALRLSHESGGGHYSWYTLEAKMNVKDALEKQKKAKQASAE